MKIYYDMYLPYMPDATKSEEGELIPDPKKSAGREAMIELVKYQATKNVMCLYQAVLKACSYAGVDLIETINNTETLDIEDFDCDIYVDMAAKMLFKSINPQYEFNVVKFSAYLLMGAHTIVDASKPHVPEEIAEVEEATNDR